MLESIPTGRNSFEGFATRRIYALFAKTRLFDAQAIDPLLLAVVERLLGPGFLLSAPTGISIGPGEAAQRLHRDDSVYPVARPHPELVVNTMWALDDFTVENGATLVVPGSHRWPADRRAVEGEAVAATMPAGSVLFYVGSLLHAGGANRTAAPRLGVILEYCAGWLRPQENHVLGVPKDDRARAARPAARAARLRHPRQSARLRRRPAPGQVPERRARGGEWSGGRGGGGARCRGLARAIRRRATLGDR